MTYTVGEPYETGVWDGDLWKATLWTIPIRNEHGQVVFRLSCKDPADLPERTLDAIEECTRMNGQPIPRRPPPMPEGRQPHGETT